MQCRLASRLTSSLQRTPRERLARSDLNHACIAVLEEITAQALKKGIH